MRLKIGTRGIHGVLISNFKSKMRLKWVLILSQPRVWDIYTTPQKTMLNYLIELKFGTHNYWHKTNKNEKF